MKTNLTDHGMFLVWSSFIKVIYFNKENCEKDLMVNC